MKHEFLESIEEAALNAWPAPRQMLVDGWLLRFAGGYSKRVNSVNVLYSSRLPLDEKIAYCEAIYAHQGQQTLFRLPEPFTAPKIYAALEKHGYIQFDPTWVMGREINIERELPSGVEVRQHTLAEWLQMRATLTETLLSTWDVHRKIVDVIVPEKALLGLYADGQSVACGMGVVDGALLGYFSIFTGLSVRRSGFGRAVMDALTQWGVERGATFGYLQVEGDNNPALAMYAKLGFEPCYTYKYYKRG